MDKFNKPKYEEQRLSQLYAYRILDTDEEEEFDFITDMAAQICGTKYSTITLVDRERQWFKSRHGIDIRETPIALSFCAHAIHSDEEFFEIKNTKLDKRFCDLPNVKGDPNITFYASYPLLTEEGLALGTLCVADDKENTLSEKQKKALKSLSSQAMRLLELRKKNFELRQNQTYYQKLIENTNGSPFRLLNDENQTSVFLTKGFEVITGYAVEDFLDNPQKSFSDFIHKDDVERILSEKAKAIQANKPWELQYRIIHSSGFIKWIEERGQTFRDEVSNEHYIDGIILDISFRKNEEILFKNIFDNSQGLICIHDFSGKIIKINSAAAASLGYELDEVLGKNLREFLNDYDYPMIDLYIKELKQSGRHKGILRLKSKNGTNKYWAYDNSVADFGGIKDIIVTNSVDITEKVRMEKTLKATEERLQLIAQTIDDAYYVYNVNKGHYEYFSPNSEKVIGVKLDFFHSDKSFNDTFVHEDDRDRVKSASLELDNGAAFNLEYRIIVDGNIRWLNEKAFPVSNGTAKEIRIAGRVTDVTQRKSIQLELENTKEILQQASKTARVGAWEVDIIERKVQWSDVMKEIHQVPQDFELQFENSLSFFKKGFNRNKASEAFDLLIKKEKPCDLELIIVDALGKEKWVRLIAKAQYKMGSCIRLYGTLQDINDIRKKTSELIKTKQQLESILSEMEDVVWAIKLPINKILFVTPSVEHLFDIQQNECLQDPDFWKQFIYEEDLKVIEEINQDLEENDCYEKEHRIRSKGGSIRWVYHVGKIIYDSQDTPIRLDIKMADITKDKEFEKQLIAETDRANAASKSKSDFLANMSHEIRTPLNGVIGFTDLLLKTELSKIQQQYANNANTAGKSLLNLINDILDFSKIEAGKLDLEWVDSDLHELLYDTLDIIKYPAGEKKLEIILDVLPDLPSKVSIDPLRLKQILINLLNNAIKFTDSGYVTLKVRLDSSDGQKSKLNFAVTDTGIGIPEEQQKKLFKAFSQADSSTTRKFGGTGLGLTISNLLAEKMGSSIGLNSEPDKGSTFYFSVDTEVISSQSIQNNQSSKVKKILLVDDNSDVRSITRRHLEFWEFECHTAANGFEALKLLTRYQDFDLAIVDYHIPYLNGIQIISQIRTELKIDAEKLPVFIMSYLSDGEELRHAFTKYQISQNLIKPLNYQGILEKIKKAHIEQPEAVKEKSSPEAKLNGEFSILVAEDISMNMLLLKTLLGNILDKVKVIECPNGKIAVENYKSNDIDLIFMDVQMPEMDGLTATENIRLIESKTGKHVPIVALTAGALKEEQRKCYEAGMDDFLTKPIHPSSLKEVLKKFLLENKIKESNSFSDSENEKTLSFNMPKLMQLIDNYQPLLKELLITSRDLVKKVEEIKKLLKIQDRDGIKANAHYIRGASQSMAFDILAKLAEKMEVNAMNGDIELMKEIFNELEREWSVLDNIIQKEINKL